MTLCGKRKTDEGKESWLRLHRLHFDPRRFTAAHTQPVAAQLKLEWIAQRSGADKRYLDAGRQTHLQQASADFIGADNPDHATLGADRKVGQQAQVTAPSSCPALPDQDVEQVIGSKTESLARESDNAGTTRLQHFDFGTPAQPQFAEATDLFRASNHLPDVGCLSGSQ
jgi:hypothetical protein